MSKLFKLAPFLAHVISELTPARWPTFVALDDFDLSVAQNTANMSIPSYKIFHVTEIQKMAYVSPIQVHP